MSVFRNRIAMLAASVCLGGVTVMSHGALVTYSFTTSNGAAPTNATRATTTSGTFTNGTNTDFDPESPAANATFSKLTTGQFANAPIGAVGTFLGATNNGSAYTLDGHAFEAATGQMANKSNGSNTAVPDTTSGYLQFTVTPAVEYKVSYSSLAFDFGYDTNTTPGNTNVGVTLLYSTDGTIFTEVGTAQTILIGAQNTYSVADDVLRDISALGEQTGTVTFRLAMADTNSSANNKLVFIDDIKLNGQVSLVPEPALLGLMAVGVTPLLMRRRSEA